AWKDSEGRSAEADAALAKAYASEACLAVARRGHQIFGAISYCEGHPLHLLHKRIQAASLDFGDAQLHLETAARAIRRDGRAEDGKPLNLLLPSMPDSFEHMPTVAIRMPNGALTSLAGNVDAHHRVAVADLILVQRRVRETIERLVREVEPDLVGLSVMTFQRHT